MSSDNPKNVLSPAPVLTDLPPVSMDAESIATDFKRYFNRTLGRDSNHCNNDYLYEALAYTIRDRLIDKWKNTRQAYVKEQARFTCYISLEFLMGRALSNAMLNLGMADNVQEALYEFGLKLEDLADSEHDAGLGNGGLGRLAACFLDSCATLQLPVLGYGLRYDYGMFRQEIVDGFQVEEPDNWLRDGNPWELERPEYKQRIKFGGYTEHLKNMNGSSIVRWHSSDDVLAIPYDIPVPGYRNETVNTLRLWKASSTDEFNLEEFNEGDYAEAVAAKNDAEHITMVLYPNDTSENGKELRLRQQYFLASASLQDTMRRWKAAHGENFSLFTEKNCFQLNDTHPSIAVAELMRLLMDDYQMAWKDAWSIVQSTMAYTNHTLLPEALEKWPVHLFEKLLPRLLEIIYEINARFLEQVSQHWPGDNARLGRMSIIEEGSVRMVRMAHLAIVGSFSVNGVAELHSELLIEDLFHDFYELWPEKFNNKTNGVTQRRWLKMCNPAQSQLMNDYIGDRWVTDLEQLRGLTAFIDNTEFRQRWQRVKQGNKQRLADLVLSECGVQFDTNALFDIQVKRIHEYKRQLLNLLHVIHLYRRIKSGDHYNWTNRCVLIGGKAAPGYYMAKLIIKLINNVAHVINTDLEVGDRLKLVFFPNYRVSAMEVICPGADLSEQISTAGKEASGTGNMKFMMNGAITIGTLDGANIEILEEVGKENFFLFGLNEDQVKEARQDYKPWEIVESDNDLRAVMDLLKSGHFNQFEMALFDPIINSILSEHDPWLTAADFRSFVDAQELVAEAYRDPDRWTRMSIQNAANSGKFSTDRTMMDYNEDIWHLKPVAPLKPD